MRRKPQTNDYSLLYERATRERDEARAEAARWKAEAERLREAIKPRGLSAGGGSDAS